MTWTIKACSIDNKSSTAGLTNSLLLNAVSVHAEEDRDLRTKIARFPNFDLSLHPL